MVKYTKEHQRQKQIHSKQDRLLQHKSNHEGNDSWGCRVKGDLKFGVLEQGRFPYPVHDVQFTAESLDGAAYLQQLESQSIVYGQTGRHSVGEVWQKPDGSERRREKSIKTRNKEPDSSLWVDVCVCVYVCDPSVTNRTEADLRRSWGGNHPSDSRPTRGGVSSLGSWATPVRWNTRARSQRGLQSQLCRVYVLRKFQGVHTGLIHSQSHRVHRPRAATASDWHSETSSVMNNSRTISQVNDQILTEGPNIHSVSSPCTLWSRARWYHFNFLCMFSF